MCINAVWCHNLTLIKFTLYPLLNALHYVVQTQAVYLPDWALGPTVITVDLTYNIGSNQVS